MEFNSIIYLLVTTSLFFFSSFDDDDDDDEYSCEVKAQTLSITFSCLFSLSIYMYECVCVSFFFYDK